MSALRRRRVRFPFREHLSSCGSVVKLALARTLLLCALSALVAYPAMAQESTPETKEDWQQLRSGWVKQLREKSFKSWPKNPMPLKAETVFDASHDGVALRAIDFTSAKDVRLRLYISHFPGLEEPDLIVLNPMDEEGLSEFLAMMRTGFEKELGFPTLPDADVKSFKQMKGMFRSFKWAMAYVALRDMGPAQGAEDRRKVQQPHAKVGTAMHVWDIRRAIQTLRAAGGMKETPLWLQSHGDMASAMLVASLFEPEVSRLDLYELPLTLKLGTSKGKPDFKMSQVVAMALERSRVVIYEKEKGDWSFVNDLATRLEWGNSLQVRTPPSDE